MVRLVKSVGVGAIASITDNTIFYTLLKAFHADVTPSYIISNLVGMTIQYVGNRNPDTKVRTTAIFYAFEITVLICASVVLGFINRKLTDALKNTKWGAHLVEKNEKNKNGKNGKNEKERLRPIVTVVVRNIFQLCIFLNVNFRMWQVLFPEKT